MKFPLRLANRLLEPLALRLLPEWRLKNWHFSKFLNEIFSFYRIGCVFDVGANTGQYIDFLRQQVGYEGWIISFEPVSKFYRQLQDKAATDVRLRVFPFALGDNSGRQRINVASSPGLTSLLQPDSAAMGALLGGPVAFTETEEIDVRTLDEVFDQLIREINETQFYLKIDTQGFDLNVIRGAVNKISHFQALQTELCMLPIYQNMPDYRIVLDELEALGFHIANMFPVSHDTDLRVIEMDGVFVAGRFPRD